MAPLYCHFCGEENDHPGKHCTRCNGVLPSFSSDASDDGPPQQDPALDSLPEPPAPAAEGAEFQKEAVLRSLEKIAGDFCDGTLSEEEYLQKIEALEELVEGVKKDFMVFLSTVREFCENPPDSAADAISCYPREAGEKLLSISHLFARSFYAMKSLAGGARDYYMEEALNNASLAMDEVERLDAISEETGDMMKNLTAGE
ncbi:MAG: hypothetical protein RDV48_12615 [Candidatus Eremiobacteraeota bacterium]|nr:hypothetical protein [Candidatus Eremiobacteraeota bacterium]